MYLRVIWDNVNSITDSCTWVLIPNTSVYLCKATYQGVYGSIPSILCLDKAAGGRRRLLRMSEREIADRAAEADKWRAVAALARLGQPRKADLLRPRKLLRRQHVARSEDSGGI